MSVTRATARGSRRSIAPTVSTDILALFRQSIGFDSAADTGADIRFAKGKYV
jgi:hypothetical protein